MLYSDFSKYKVIGNLIKFNIKVNQWINIDDDDKNGILSIKNRIFNLKNDLINVSSNEKLILDKNKKYLITGLGSSKSHAFYFKHIAKKYQNIDIEFIPISNKYITNDNSILILITQGLSNNTHCIIKKWNYKNIILLTGKNINNLDNNHEKNYY